MREHRALPDGYVISWKGRLGAILAGLLAVGHGLYSNVGNIWTVVIFAGLIYYGVLRWRARPVEDEPADE